MKVHELIAFLQTQPQDLTVIYQCFSEAVMLEPGQIQVVNMCEARPDGWVHDYRPDKPQVLYLRFPGN